MFFRVRIGNIIATILSANLCIEACLILVDSLPCRPPRLFKVSLQNYASMVYQRGAIAKGFFLDLLHVRFYVGVPFSNVIKETN